MATKRELIIKTTDQLGNSYQSTYSHANPAATPAQIDSCARALVGLSKRTYVDTIRVDSTSINEALAE